MVRLLLFKYISTFSSTSLCFACQWKAIFFSEIYVGFVFFHVIPAIFLNIQSASYPFHIHTTFANLLQTTLTLTQ